MKTFPIRIDDELHKRIKHSAIEDDTSVHSWILDAINSKLNNGNLIIRENTPNYESSVKSTGKRRK